MKANNNVEPHRRKKYPQFSISHLQVNDIFSPRKISECYWAAIWIPAEKASCAEENLVKAMMGLDTSGDETPVSGKSRRLYNGLISEDSFSEELLRNLIWWKDIST